MSISGVCGELTLKSFVAYRVSMFEDILFLSYHDARNSEGRR